jgi:demethylmenaquinone methyltransferase/2-methoxy-6-polyprenyl-1,4-benzoquinol methylase
VTRTRGQRLYDRWSHHPLLFRAGYELAFGGQYGTLRERAYDACGPGAGDAVLDLACGWGTNLRPLSDRVGPTGRVVGLDYSVGMVQRARGRARTLPPTRDVCVVRGDARRLPFPDDAFDAAHCALALTAIPDPERAVAEVDRVLRPGGRFAVFDTRPFRDRPWTALNPLVERASALATNWHPDADVLGALCDTFGTVEVETENRGTAYVAAAWSA